MLTAKGFTQTSEDWQSLRGLWDRAALIRVFLWQQQYEDGKALLVQFLVRLRRLFGVDFCSGGLLDGEILSTTGVPEAGMETLPANFADRCLTLVAHAREPVTWNEVKAEFGFRSMVVAPVASPSATPLGFLLLGHANRRVYSAVELFVLQNLASELAWVARELRTQKQQRGQLGDILQHVDRTRQSLAGYTGLIRKNLDGALGSDQEQVLAKMESDIERLRWQLSQPMKVLSTDPETPKTAVASLAKTVDDPNKNSVS